MKRCTKCGEEKAREDFYKDRSRKDGYYPSCRPCTRATKAASRAKHYSTERNREYQRRYKMRHPDRVRAQYRRRGLRVRFGLTVAEVDALIARQGGVCAICGLVETSLSNARRPEQREVRSLSVDHCHRTGQIRGALCARCNTALGLLDELPERLRRAIDYLNGVPA